MTDGAFSEVGGHEDDVGFLADELGELGGEVLVAELYFISATSSPPSFL